MKLKNISLICIMLLILMTIGVVSASEDVNYDNTIYNLTEDDFRNDNNTIDNRDFEDNDLITDNTPFTYSFLIPSYVNVTGAWRVTPDYCGEEYYVTGGVGGIVKLPTLRSLLIPTNNGWMEYGVGYEDYNYENRLTYGSSTFITLNSDGTGILIKVDKNCINITYKGFLTNNVSQISGLFKHDYNGMAMSDYENIQVIVNGEVMMDIFISDPIGYDDSGLRFQLAKGQFILGLGEYTLAVPYNRFANYNSVKFVNTKEYLIYSDDMMRVYNFPSTENVITSFKVNGTNIVKTETIGYGLNNAIIENGFEVVQSFIISKIHITDEIVSYYLNQNNNFPIGAMKAVYGTFLTALSTNWMFDNLMENLTEIYNVSATRNKYNVVMSGVEFGGASYVHCPNPNMGLTLNGDNSTNVIVCRLISSLGLSEIENSALNLAGINGTSSVNAIFSKILNLENFTVEVEDNYLIISLNNSKEYKVIFDLDTGLVYDLYQVNGFIYKGAVSTNNSYCYHDYLTDNIRNNLQNQLNERNGNISYGLGELSEEELDILKNYTIEFIGELGLSISEIGVENIIFLISIGALATPIFFKLPVILAIGGLCVCFIAKSYSYKGDIGRGLADSLLNLAYKLSI